MDSRKCLSKAGWILANAYQKPRGFSQMLIKSRVDSRKPFIKSRVDSRKPFIKSRVDSRKCLSKAEWILANVYRKPSGFSQTFYEAGWILANVLPSRVDSHKCFTKPGGFSQMFYQAGWILADVYQAEWILADVYQAKRVLAHLVLSPVDSGEIFYETRWISSKLS